MNLKLSMNFSNNFTVCFFKHLFSFLINIIILVISTDDRSILSEDDDDFDEEDISRRAIHRALTVIIFKKEI
jgi:hypothetical protein